MRQVSGRNYKHIIFDLDGTLIDSAPSILHCFRIALKQNQLKPIIPLTYEIIGPPLSDTLKKLTGIDSPLIINSLIDCFRDAYDTTGYKASIPYSDIVDMLNAVSSSGVSVHLATNKRIIPTMKILEYFSWCSFFNSVYALDIVEIEYKSKADMLASILKEKNLDPSSTVYVGDINADYLAAQKCDMQFIFAEWGYEKRGAFQYPASAYNVQDLTQKLLNK